MILGEPMCCEERQKVILREPMCCEEREKVILREAMCCEERQKVILRETVHTLMHRGEAVDEGKQYQVPL